jgi:hypothetical protein
MNEFINWGDMSCDFTGDYFKDLASFAKAYTGGYPTTSGNGTAIGFRGILNIIQEEITP